MRFLLALVPVALLAGCGGGGNNTSSDLPKASTPVAAIPAPAGKSWTDVVEATPEGGYRMGNPNAPIKLLEYGSRTCPVCGEFGRTGMEPLEQKYVATGKVSYEFREFLVHGAPDIAPALLGRCGGAAPFFPLLEQMYQAQEPVEQKMMSDDAKTLQQRTASLPPIEIGKAWGQFLGYIDFVKQRGIPEAKAMQCLNDQKELDRITKIMQDATDKGVNGTPSFFINGVQVPDAITWQQLEPKLRDAGA